MNQEILIFLKAVGLKFGSYFEGISLKICMVSYMIYVEKRPNKVEKPFSQNKKNS